MAEHQENRPVGDGDARGDWRTVVWWVTAALGLAAVMLAPGQVDAAQKHDLAALLVIVVACACTAVGVRLLRG